MVRTYFNNIKINILQASKLAMEVGWAINIGGGFKHFTTNISSAGGLALYDDILVCLAVSNGYEFECIYVHT